MSEKLKEALSAVMDGEADEFEIRRVLNEASADELLRARWHRYHLIGDVLRSGALGRRSTLSDELLERRMTHVLARIRQHIDAETIEGPQEEPGSALSEASEPWHADAPAGAALPAGASRAGPVRKGRGSWLGPMTGVAVAASVAVAVVVGVGGLQRQPSEPAPQMAEAERGFVPTRQPTASSAEAQQPVSVSAPPSSLDEHRAQAYMLHHVHHTSLNYQASVVPFAKVAAFEPR